MSNLLIYSSGLNGTKLKFAVEVKGLQALKHKFMSSLLLLIVNFVKFYLTILFKILTGFEALRIKKGPLSFGAVIVFLINTVYQNWPFTVVHFVTDI